MKLDCREVEKKEWDEFVESNGGSVFHKFNVARIAANSNNSCEFVPLGIYQNSQLIAIQPIFNYSKKNPGLSPLSTYSGIIIKEDFLSKGYSFKSDIYQCISDFFSGCRSIQIATNPGETDARPLKWLGFSANPSYTYLLRIKKPEKMFESFEKKTRNILRKGESYKQVKISEVNSSSKEIEHFFEMWRHTHERSGIGVPRIDDCLLKISRELGKDFMIFRADHEKNPAAYAVVLKSKEAAYYWQAASDERYWHYKVPQSLIWYVAKELHKRQVKTMDLMGCNVEAIARYKSGFNPELNQYFICTKDNRKRIPLIKKIFRM